MNTLSWITSHLEAMNVTGAERALMLQIQREIDPDGIRSELDDLGALYLSGENKDCFVTSPVDVPGYLLLQQYPDRSYFVFTKAKAEDRGECLTLIGSDGKVLKANRTEGDDPLYYATMVKDKIGTPFKELTTIAEENGILRGRYLGKYVLSYVLSLIAATQKNPVLFATQGESRAPVEYNFAMREKFKSAILLGLMESETEDPIVVVKGGKHFSDEKLICKAEKAGFTPLVCSEEVTKAALCANAGVQTLSLALPVRKTDDGEDLISLQAIDLFINTLSRLL